MAVIHLFNQICANAFIQPGDIFHFLKFNITAAVLVGFHESEFVTFRRYSLVFEL